jgi:hypothetical protein
VACSPELSPKISENALHFHRPTTQAVGNVTPQALCENKGTPHQRRYLRKRKFHVHIRLKAHAYDGDARICARFDVLNVINGP